MSDTSIEWTDKTWNPVSGCTKISSGCTHCYAETIADRFFAKQYPPNPDGSPRKFTDVRCHPDRLDQPLHWKKPCRVFVNSMSDLFHEDVPTEFIDRVFAVMGVAHQHTFQVLTKRAQRMLAYCENSERQNTPGRIAEIIVALRHKHGDDVPVNPLPYLGAGATWYPLPNVQLGVSIENQPEADRRVPLLQRTSAAVRFLSVEPQLEAIRLPRKVFLPHAICGDFPIGHTTRVGIGEHVAFSNPHGALSVLADDGKLLGIKPGEFKDEGLGIDWVICGGESGPGARPFNLAWAESLLKQCKAAGVPFFMKQVGSNPVSNGDGPIELKDSRYKGGDMSEWPEQLRVREYPR